MTDLYTTKAHVTGGRDGRAVTDDGKLDVAMATPKEIGGSGEGTNPEQLFAAGFAGCFTSSIKFTAQSRGLNPGDVSTDATVTLGVGDDGRYGLAVALSTTVTGLSGDELDTVIAEAKRVCAYTNAVRNNVPVTVSVNA